jgi:hypothetical protein
MTKVFEKGETEPAWGVVQISAPQGGARELFGSLLKHDRTVCLKISGAKRYRELHREWIMEDQLLVELELSQAQWAHMVSSIGNGSGTPCTIRYREGEHTSLSSSGMANQKDYADEMKDTAKKAMDKVSGAEKKLREFISPGSKPPTKAQLVELVNMLSMASQDVVCNMPFVVESLEEVMDSIVTEAKSEIHAHMEQMKATAGLPSDTKLIETKEEDNV